MKPTIVLVHGGFAESASWNNVIDSLAGAGHPVIAAPNPLRSPAADAAAAAAAVSHPGQTAELILQATALPAAA